jgi:hypothetical protein
MTYVNGTRVNTDYNAKYTADTASLFTLVLKADTENRLAQEYNKLAKRLGTEKNPAKIKRIKTIMAELEKYRTAQTNKTR